LGIGDFVDCTITNTSKPVSIALQKHAGVPTDVNGNGLTDAGDRIAFTFTVTNTGALPLSGISVSDPTAGSITCPAPSLATGASETCTADNVYTVTAADEAAGSITNTATASGAPAGTTLPTGSPPSSTTTPTESPQPLVSIIKTGVASDGFGSPLRVGETISYTYLVTNIGNVVLTSVAVDDPTLGSVTCPTPAPPGLDIGASPGTPVEAPAEGTVIAANSSGDYGRYVMLDHGNGVRSLYGHLQKADVKIGERVEAGEVIGHSGASGHTTGPHLHYEVWVRDQAQNPIQYILDEYRSFG